MVNLAPGTKEVGHGQYEKVTQNHVLLWWKPAMFADDSAFLTDGDDEDSRIPQEIEDEGGRFGLKINGKKTVVMTSDSSPATVRLDGSTSEHQLMYLGSIID